MMLLYDIVNKEENDYQFSITKYWYLFSELKHREKIFSILISFRMFDVFDVF